MFNVLSEIRLNRSVSHKSEVHILPDAWETREICKIMNTGIVSGTIKDWRAYKNPKRYAKYGSKKRWERVKAQGMITTPPR